MMFQNGPGWRFAGRGRMGGRGRGRHGFGPGPGGPGGPGGDGGFDGPWRGRLRDLFDDRPPRADRGAVRFLVLDALREAPRHGYEIMAAIETKSQGSYRPSPGVVYPTLQLLEELGHVRVSVKDDKKVYALTASGAKELDEHADDVAGFYEQAEGVWQDHGDELFELVHVVRKMMRTVRRAARRGRLTSAKAAKLRAIMQDTVGKLEALFDE